jgi:hypothetical protein
MADKAFDKFGYVATLAEQVPGLRNLLRTALAQNYTPEEFSRKLQDSSWWKQTPDSAKQAAILKATKPGEFKQQRTELETKVRNLASQMGVSTFHGDFAHLVNTALTLGWDDTELQQHIGAYFNPGAGRTASGTGGALQQQLREARMQYGLGGNDDTVAFQTKRILAGLDTVDGIKAQYAASASHKFPAFAKQLQEGQTMTQIADPYVQTIAQTLELNPSDVDFYDPSVQRALTARNAKGEPAPMALWQVQDMMRQDPRYDHTKQAVSDAYSMINQIGKDWGFSG